MSDSNKISVEELAAKRAFRKWILNPKDMSSSFWEQWCREEEGRPEIVEKAKLLVMAIEQQFGETFDEKLVQADLQKLISRASQNREPGRVLPLHPKKRSLGFIWRIAASVILILSVGLWYTRFRQSDVPAVVKAFSGVADNEWITRQNDGDTPLTVLLSDGSVVMLEKQSELIYPSSFSGKNRTVYLKGDAFFDVTKDAAKPFLVFAGQTVTKVLGTSFRVRATNADGEVLVAVKTGRVSVSSQQAFSNAGGADSSMSVILDPNEEIRFGAKARQNEKELIADAEILTSMPDETEVVFEERPVSEVLKSIERKYGIDIVYDEEKIASCLVSTVFKEEGLKQRLNAVCTAIGATYIVEGEKVIVRTAQPCN